MSRKTSQWWTVPLLLSLGCLSRLAAPQEQKGEDSPLGDVARRTRREKDSAGHAVGKKILDEEHLADHPVKMRYSAGSDWGLIVYLPAASGAHPELPYYVHQVDLAGSKISIAIDPGRETTTWKEAEQKSIGALLQSTGLSSSRVTVETWNDTRIGGQLAVITRVKFQSRSILHIGKNALVSINGRVMAVGCFYRQVDSDKASPVCDDVIGSIDVYRPPLPIPKPQTDSEDPPVGEDDP